MFDKFNSDPLDQLQGLGPTSRLFLALIVVLFLELFYERLVGRELSRCWELRLNRRRNAELLDGSSHVDVVWSSRRGASRPQRWTKY